MAWAAELRAQFNPLGMSISLFCRLHPIDKGTVSRYLNGKRVPADRWFLDQIIVLRATAGTRVTDEVRAHLWDLQMGALQVAHPHEYRVRKVSDQLEIAVTSWKEAERYVNTLEEELAQRNRTYQDLLIETERLRTAWNEDRTRYQEEIIEAVKQLELAHNRLRQAEHRVQVLEELLDQLESDSPSQDKLISDINSDDLKAVAGLVDSFRRAGAESQITMLIEQIPDFSLSSRDALDVAALLDALRRAGAKERIARLVERVPELSITTAYAMARMLDALRRVGAKEQIAMLSERFSDLPFDPNEQYSTNILLEALRRANIEEQIVVLLEPMSELRVHSIYTFVELLEVLHRIGAEKQMAMLLDNVPSYTLRSVYEATVLLEGLHRIKAKEQISMIVERVVDLPLENGTVMVGFLDALREVEAASQILLMAENIATDLLLDNPYTVARVLECLHWAGADDQVEVLAERASSGVSIHSGGTTYLLKVMREVGTALFADVLAERIAEDKASDPS